MITWISTHQDFILFSLMITFFTFGYTFGRASKSEEIEHLINDYENLLNLAYTDKQNLVVALASIQSRQEGQYLGYRVSEPKIYNSSCTCEFCERMREI